MLVLGMNRENPVVCLHRNPRKMKINEPLVHIYLHINPSETIIHSAWVHVCTNNLAFHGKKLLKGIIYLYNTLLDKGKSIYSLTCMNACA
jgi:hypothetical protein